jgi:hypothetical protein
MLDELNFIGVYQYPNYTYCTCFVNGLFGYFRLRFAEKREMKKALDFYQA